MKIIYKAPGGKPEIRDIPNELEELQAAVGGYIEAHTFDTDFCVICNEEGWLLDLPYNLNLLGVNWFGPILIVGIDGEKFTDIPPETAGAIVRGLN